MSPDRPAGLSEAGIEAAVRAAAKQQSENAFNINPNDTERGPLERVVTAAVSAYLTAAASPVSVEGPITRAEVERAAEALWDEAEQHEKELVEAGDGGRVRTYTPKPWAEAGYDREEYFQRAQTTLIAARGVPVSVEPVEKQPDTTASEGMGEKALDKEKIRAAYRSVPTVRMGAGRTYAAFEEGWRACLAASQPVSEADYAGEMTEKELFIMLNPSTADASIDDPTIRRCIGFARAWARKAARVA